MVNINWCKKQKSGIKIVEPNINLSEDYIKSSEDTLVLLKDIKGRSNMWSATMKYYCEYFAVYSLLIRIGIKCEIHDCTIEISKLLEKEGILPKGTFSRLEKDKVLRVDNQYYLKNIKVDIDFSEISDFILQIKNIASALTLEEINKMRKSFI
jgi:uncharacterized protein (UPF0332 family)